MLTGFQLKVAKSVLNITAKEIANEIGVHEATITRLCNIGNLEYLPCNAKKIVALVTFFKKRNITFNSYPIANSITLETNTPCIDSSEYTITRFQLKAARVAANLTQEELSALLKISSSSLSIMENLKNDEYIVSSKVDIRNLKRVFELLGIVFSNSFSVALQKDPISILVKKN